MADGDGVEITEKSLREDDWVSACRNVEIVGRKVEEETGRLGENV